MRAVFMGKHKRSAARALEHLVQSGWEVPAVVCPAEDALAVESQRVDLVAERHGLRMVSDDDLYAALEGDGPQGLELGDVELVVSFLFWKKLLPPLIRLGRVGALNFHPAPLPDLRGLGGFNVAILEARQEFGVSCHFVDTAYDTGDLVEVERFPLEPDESAWSLDVKSQERLFGMFTRVTDAVLRGEELPREPQGEGRYVTREEFTELRRVREDDTPETLERRVRAFWYPPYDGAAIERGGETLTVVDRAMLERMGRQLRSSGRVP